MTEQQNRTTVYYDGACPVCRREIAFMQRRAGSENVAFEDISDEKSTLPEGVAREAALARFHVRGTDGIVRNGAAGFAAMWEELPALRPLARLARFPGVLPLLEVLYRGFLRIRPAIQRVVIAWDKRREA